MFEGSMVAIITPMLENGSIDMPALDKLVDWHLESKTHAIIVNGTTGESATLSADEQFEIISRVVKRVSRKIPIIAGTGTNSTSTTLKLTEKAKDAGVDACLIVTPYYNKPTQNGLFVHYKTIADTVSIPIILYNVPGRTACDLLPETVERLSQLNHIIGIKEATGKLERTQEILQRCHKKFVVYSGDDATALDLMRAGAKGVISVTANVAPVEMVKMCQLALNQQFEQAEKINNRLMLLHTNLFIESNPIPTKWALMQLGKIRSGIRLPLLTLDKKYHEEVKEALQNAGVI